MMPLSTRCFAQTFVLTAALSAAAYGQSGPAPGPRLQYSAMTGANNTVTISRVPVVNSSGQTVYQDVTLQFDSDDSGNLTLSAGFPIVTPSPNLLVSSFQAGRYTGPRSAASGKASITVNGPGVSTGGSTVWTSSSNPDSDPCTYPGSATWYVGPIDNNPLLTRINKVKINTTAWTFGIAGNGIAFSCGGGLSFAWGNGAIIGVSQTGNTITFASFTNNSFDQASPVDQITYTLSQQ
jgi:hypothetical protein